MNIESKIGLIETRLETVIRELRILQSDIHSLRNNDGKPIELNFDLIDSVDRMLDSMTVATPKTPHRLRVVRTKIEESTSTRQTSEKEKSMMDIQTRFSNVIKNSKLDVKDKLVASTIEKAIHDKKMNFTIKGSDSSSTFKLRNLYELLWKTKRNVISRYGGSLNSKEINLAFSPKFVQEKPKSEPVRVKQPSTMSDEESSII